MPLKPVGCQVIEEAQSVQPHRHRSQSASLAESREASARQEGNGEERERPNYKGTWGETGTQQRPRVGEKSHGGRVPLTAACSCSFALCGS